MSKITISILGLLSLLLLVFASCSSSTLTTTIPANSSAPVTTTSSAPNPPVTITPATNAPSLIVTTSAPVQPAPVFLKIGSLPRIFDLIAFVAQKEGLFEKNNLKVEIVSFRSTVEMNNALLAGQLDGSIQGTFEAVNLNKEQEQAKLIGHNFMPRMFEIMTSPYSNIHKPADLVGREMATGTGTIMEYATDMLLKNLGIDSKGITYINVPNIALRVEMLNQAKVPSAVLTSPASDLAIVNGNKVILDDSKYLLGGPGLIFSMTAIKTKSEAVQKFLNAWQESVDLINANPAKYHGLLVDVAKVSETVAGWIKVPVFPKLRLPDELELKSVMDWMIGKKYLTQSLPYEKVVETKYIRGTK